MPRSLLALLLLLCLLCLTRECACQHFYALRPAPSDALPLVELYEEPDPALDPGERDLNETELRRALGHFDARFLSTSPPLPPEQEHENEHERHHASGSGDLHVGLKKKKMKQKLHQQKKKRRRRLWLRERTLCPVAHAWTDLGARFWPRYVRLGSCSRERSCSVPAGMLCTAAASTHVTLLRWRHSYLAGPPCRWTVRDDSSSAAAQCSVGPPQALHQWSQEAALRTLPTGRTVGGTVLILSSSPPRQKRDSPLKMSRSMTVWHGTIAVFGDDSEVDTLRCVKKLRACNIPQSYIWSYSCNSVPMHSACTIGGRLHHAATTFDQQIRVWRHHGLRQDEPEGLVSLHLHPYCTICRNCVKMFKLHGMDYHRTPLGSSTAPYRDVWHVGPLQQNDLEVDSHRDSRFNMDPQHRDSRFNMDPQHRDSRFNLDSQHRDLRCNMDPQHSDSRFNMDPQHRDSRCNMDPQHRDSRFNKDPQHRNLRFNLDPQHRDPRINLDPQHRDSRFNMDPQHRDPRINLDPQHRDSRFNMDPQYRDSRFNLDPQHRDLRCNLDPQHRDSRFNMDPQHRDSRFNMDPQHRDSRLNMDPQHRDLRCNMDPQHRDSRFNMDPQHRDSRLNMDPQHRDLRCNMDPQHRDLRCNMDPQHRDLRFKLDSEHRDSRCNLDPQHRNSRCNLNPQHRDSRFNMDPQHRDLRYNLDF
ncbi:hypothetical protein NFI96_004771 [Prochilodus magdalenae]|nr:hypothetical protein NFI96_004771 [Prochilodus magdalenae]